VRRVVLLLALAVAAPGPASRAAPGLADSGDLPEYHAEDPAAAAVTPANLLGNERFWPYHVSLTRAWRPEERESPLLPGASGVLIRVEDGGSARIDFGRDGLYTVPVAATDLVERANSVRRGELEKMAPNFVLAIGSRLIDAAADPPRAQTFRDVGERHVFLSVFADPRAPDFEALAKSLAPLHERAGLLTIVFPQGERPDPEVWERLRALGWPVAYVPDHLADSYTRSLLPEGLAPPALLLQTREGRLLFQAPAEPAAVAALDAALGRVQPAAAAAAP